MEFDHLVEYQTNNNKVLKQAFQSMQRIRLNCFDASTNFLVFGASSGGIYIFKEDPCEFKKLIPSKEGSASIVAISRDERHIGVATIQGLVLFIENFKEDTGLPYHVFNIHQGNCITCLKWHYNALYVGDSKGILSVISLDRGLDSTLFPTKSLFQLPATILMDLDSCIVQIDCFDCYLLISTQNKTYLCNTEKEYFIQIGKKLRDGVFGTCFLINSATDLSYRYKPLQNNYNSAFRFAKELDVVVSSESPDVRIFCARPGARLWEAGFDAQVLRTYQFKESLKEKLTPTELLVITSGEEAVLQKRINDGDLKIEEFNFRILRGIDDKYILTYDSKRLYIFDVISSKLAFWTGFSSGIKHVAVVKSRIYVWHQNMELTNLMVVELENILLSALYKKQYYLCIDLCLEFKTELLELFDYSKKLYLLYTLKNKISDPLMMEQLEPIFKKIEETNEKIQIHKTNIVQVENLFSTNQELPVPLLQKSPVVSSDMALIFKQYKLNKTHSTIDIPDVVNLLESQDFNQMYETLIRFQSFVKTELEEDATDWCQLQCLKQATQRNCKELNNEMFEFLLDALIKENSAVNYSCTCGYPLPKCHKYMPKFYTVALCLYESRRNSDKIIRDIPYLWKHRVKSEVFGLNMTALIQYSNLELFKQHTLQLTYDNWHDILGYFVKINNGLCLNCDRSIDVDSLLTWSDVGKCIVQSLGSKNAIRILEKYEHAIPKGALDATFYQTCIFAHTVTNNNEQVKPEVACQFVDQLDRNGLEQFQDIIAKYFRRKYAASRNPYYTFCPVNSTSLCLICKLPLKNDILSDCETVKDCGHKFHKFCFDQGDQICTLCE